MLSGYARGNPGPATAPNTGKADGATGHKTAMKKADAGHGLLKKYEELGQVIDQRRKTFEPKQKQQADALMDRIDNLYTAEHKGSTVLRCTDGMSIAMLRTQIEALLGRDTVERVLGNEETAGNAN